MHPDTVIDLSDIEWPEGRPPVVIWCDDIGGAGSVELPQQDAGWAMFEADNGIRRTHSIMEEHEEVVITHFVVPKWSNDIIVNRTMRVEWDNVQSIDDNDRGFRDWIRNLDGYKFYEFQLHGYNHRYRISRPRFRIPLIAKARAYQEFELYNTFKEAFENTQRAVDIFKSTFNRMPTGNRFPGWKPDKFGMDAMIQNGIKWFSHVKCKNRCHVYGNDLVNLPVGHKLNEVTFKEIDEAINRGSGLFITTHIEGSTPTATVENSIYHLHEWLDKILYYIEDNHDVWWTGGEALAQHIIRSK